VVVTAGIEPGDVVALRDPNIDAAELLAGDEAKAAEDKAGTP
jgi:hypothetical protein